MIELKDLKRRFQAVLKEFQIIDHETTIVKTSIIHQRRLTTLSFLFFST